MRLFQPVAFVIHKGIPGFQVRFKGGEQVSGRGTFQFMMECTGTGKSPMVIDS